MMSTIRPPPDLPCYSIPAGEGFEDLHTLLESTDLPSRSPPVEFHEQFLLGFGEPPHVELDEAIDDGDADRVLTELTRARGRYPQPHVTFNTAIQRAIKYEQFDIVRLLLDNGVPVDDCNIQAAALRGNIPIFAHLMKQLSCPINAVFDSGHTLLTIAVRNKDMVAWLLSQGADPNVQDAWSETPLSRAIESGPKSVIKMLLDAGADITQGAPIHMSLRRDGITSSLELTEELLGLGAPVDKFEGENSSMWDKVQFQRGTALHHACIKGNLAAVQLLLAHGADPRRNQRLAATEIPKSSPLDETSDRGYSEISAVLKRHMDNSDASRRSNL